MEAFPRAAIGSRHAGPGKSSEPRYLPVEAGQIWPQHQPNGFHWNWAGFAVSGVRGCAALGYLDFAGAGPGVGAGPELEAAAPLSAGGGGGNNDTHFPILLVFGSGTAATGEQQGNGSEDTGGLRPINVTSHNT